MTLYHEHALQQLTHYEQLPPTCMTCTHYIHITTALLYPLKAFAQWHVLLVSEC